MRSSARRRARLFGASRRSRGASGGRSRIAASPRLVWIVLPGPGILHRGEAPHDSLSATIVAARAGRRLGALSEEENRVPEAALLVARRDDRHLRVGRARLPRPLPRAGEALDELRTIDDRFSGQGPAMLDEFEEYGKHYLRDVPPVVPFDAWTPAAPSLRTPGCRSTPAIRHRRDDASLRGAVPAADPAPLAGREPPAPNYGSRSRAATTRSGSARPARRSSRTAATGGRTMRRPSAVRPVGRLARAAGRARDRGRRAPGADRPAGPPHAALPRGWPFTPTSA